MYFLILNKSYEQTSYEWILLTHGACVAIA